DQIYDVYKKRWRIEEYHKSIKQNASLEKSPTKVEAHKVTIFLHLLLHIASLNF
ncbi:MAG: transposase, partial [Chlamydiae bacterium]|nr:transposase [Chlamydiota bacterium]